MQWIETIEVRTVNSDRCDLESRLIGFMAEAATLKMASTIAVYQRAMIESDFCVQIIHETEGIENWGSPLGLGLVNALQEFGLVHHSVWVKLKAP